VAVDIVDIRRILTKIQHGLYCQSGKAGCECVAKDFAKVKAHIIALQKTLTQINEVTSPPKSDSYKDVNELSLNIAAGFAMANKLSQRALENSIDDQ